MLHEGVMYYFNMANWDLKKFDSDLGKFVNAGNINWGYFMEILNEAPTQSLDNVIKFVGKNVKLPTK